MRPGSKAVIAAISADAAATVIKFVAAAITGSAGMLSQAIQSAVDTADSALLAWSARYEIVEAYTAQMYPGEEQKFLGMQGDIFDAQRDMTCALLGAVISMVLVALAQTAEEDKQTDQSGPKPAAGSVQT
jgi:hypothetical protein